MLNYQRVSHMENKTCLNPPDDQSWGFNMIQHTYPGLPRWPAQFHRRNSRKKPCLVVVSYPPGGGQKLHFFGVFLGPERYLGSHEKKSCPILSKKLLILSHDFFIFFLLAKSAGEQSQANASRLAAICCCCCCSICPAFRDGQHLVFKSPWQLYVHSHHGLRFFSDITQNGQMGHTQWICGINRLLLVVLKYKHVKQTHILP